MNVFLSHSAADREVAREVANALAQSGTQVWDPDTMLKPGDSLAAAIEDGIRRSDAVIFLMSPAWTKSDWAQAEVAVAVDESKQLIPVLVEDIQPPALLRRLQYLDLRDPAARGGRLPLLVDALRRGSGRVDLNAEWRQLHANRQALAFEAEQQELLLHGRQRLLQVSAVAALVLALLIIAGAIVGGPDEVAVLVAPLTSLFGAIVGYHFGRRGES